MEDNTQKSKEEIKQQMKAKDWQGKIASARIDASQGATLFKVLAFISAFAGIPLSYVGNSTLIILGGFVVGFLLLGISYILQAQEVMIYKLFDHTKNEGSENDGQN